MPCQLLKCDPATIHFGAGDAPEISSKATRDALNIASRNLITLKRPVVFPTETVYGLGALALDSSAASLIFSTKGRPADNPLIVHVSSMSMLHSILPPNYTLPPSYEVLMKHFWPGPLTMLFPRHAAVVPDIVTAGQDTVAIRMPSHPVARALIAVANAPLAAPSANSSGKPSPTRAEHVYRDLGDKVDVILDGGPCGVGLESTVVDGLNADGNLRVLRPGGVTVEDLERTLREELHASGSVPRVLVHRRDYRDEAMEAAPTTPGMKYKHYSPSVPVILVHTLSNPSEPQRRQTIDNLVASLQTRYPARPIHVGLMTPDDSRLAQVLHTHESISWRLFPLGKVSEPAVIAQRLFDGFLTLDREGVDAILIEGVAEEEEGLAVMNRVRKAAGETVWVSL
ncbi:DHBP synthase RibB-like alpha/beta domain-containing protein [Schizophyllum commune]